MVKSFTHLLSELPGLRDGAGSIQEMLLANLAMIGEIPSPTFGEEARVNLLVQRFSECGLHNCSTDNVGNGVGILPGEDEESNILVVAHTDTPFADDVDHIITFHKNHLTGLGIGDNSFGVAMLASLPTMLTHLNVSLKSNLILMGASRSLGRGNLEGLGFFLSNNSMPIRAGVCLEGVHLGRLSFASAGMIRGEISVSVLEERNWDRLGTANAIVTLNEVINGMTGISIPRRPRTRIVLGSITGGTSHNTVPTKALLGFEVQSDSAEMVRKVSRELHDICAEVSSISGAKVSLNIFARRKAGGIRFTHPLVRRARRILTSLGVQIRPEPSTSELSAFMDRGIPAITIGLTTGEQIGTTNEAIRIKPMFSGVAQLVGILMAIDAGFCDED